MTAIAAPDSINAQGWNSGAGDYVRTRTPGVRRVAVIGDSYVEALHVPSTASVAETLARALSRGGETVQTRRWQVYRFGISGAPLSRYVHMAERVPGRYTSSFLKFRIEDGKVAVEVPPAGRRGPPPPFDRVRLPRRRIRHLTPKPTDQTSGKAR